MSSFNFICGAERESSNFFVDNLLQINNFMESNNFMVQ